MEYLIIIVGNFLIGGMIGLTGIAGFLLPMLYSGFLGMSSAQGLALSFFAFLISGILGAYARLCSSAGPKTHCGWGNIHQKRKIGRAHV